MTIDLDRAALVEKMARAIWKAMDQGLLEPTVLPFEERESDAIYSIATAAITAYEQRLAEETAAQKPHGART